MFGIIGVWLLPIEWNFLFFSRKVVLMPQEQIYILK